MSQSQIPLGSNRPSHDDKPKASTSTQPRLPSLQFISVGHGGKVSNLRTVRAHVSKEYHQKKKETKKAHQSKLVQQRKATLQSRGDSNSGKENSKETRIDSDEEVINKGQLEEVKTGGLELIPQDASLPSSISYQGNCKIYTMKHSSEQTHLLTLNLVIPYAWFEKDGPILYVNKSKWPFPTDLNVTGSDRNDLSYKSLTPRQSHWMPHAKYQLFMIASVLFERRPSC